MNNSGSSAKMIMFGRIVVACIAASIAFCPVVGRTEPVLEVLLPVIYPNENTDALVTEAFSHPYGEAHISAFAEAIQKDADPKCLQTNSFDEASLRKRGHDIFQRYGRRMLDVLHKVYDGPHYPEELTALAGYQATRTFERFSSDPEIQQFRKTLRPVQLGQVVDHVIENFQRYVLINRIKLRPFSWIETNDPKLGRLNPMEQLTALRTEQERLLPNRELYPAHIKDYLLLSADINKALNNAFLKEDALSWGPGQYFEGVDKELAALCIATP